MFDPVMRRILATILVVCISLGVSCAERTSSGQPASDPGPRLAVLSPAFAATLADLGCADLIVARHAYDIALEKTVPVCGDQGGINYEVLVRANPTHVILESNTQPPPER